MQTLAQQRGFNLIEALIATVVLTLGLLGVAALQLTGIRNTNGSYFRSQATTIMNDLAERIYANAVGSADYVFDPAGSSACASAPSPLCAMESTATINACTPAQMAAYDVYRKACGASGASRLLPGGTLQVFCIDAASGVQTACAPGLRMQITVGWQEQGAITGGASNVVADTAQSISMVIQP